MRDLGSPPRFGDRRQRLHNRFCFLTALGDDPQAVVVKRFYAVSAPLYELHLSVEALRDAVVFTEAPHSDDLLLPVVEGFAEGLGLGKE